jgi:hypothetical protein
MKTNDEMIMNNDLKMMCGKNGYSIIEALFRI